MTVAIEIHESDLALAKLITETRFVQIGVAIMSQSLSDRIYWTVRFGTCRLPSFQILKNRRTIAFIGE